MANSSENLVKYGFIKPKYNSRYAYHPKKKIFQGEHGISGKHADEEVAEEANIKADDHSAAKNPYLKTGYPAPFKRYRLIFESMNASIEESYFWVLEQLRQDQAFPYVDKIMDIFSAAENSAFFGNSQQRLGIQQDRVSTFLATIGKMIKDLFQLVREMRIIDERLQPYKDWQKTKSADVTLKGLYIDFVEGGVKNPSSVFGLAQQVGFAILPDLFFNTHVFELDEIDRVVDGMKFNKQIKNILKRKLFAYINWKEKTEKELESRRIFTLKYLRQHWDVIRMYMSWIKPNLKNIKQLQMNRQQMDSADIISAFETSMTEIEILARKPTSAGYNGVVLVNFTYRTRPTMSYQSEGYQKGPLHVGRMELNLRAYGWSDFQIENYKRMREAEEMDLLGMIDSSVKAAMEALGDELMKYLEEAGEAVERENLPEPKRKAQIPGAADPFVSLFKGFGEIFSAFFPVTKVEKSHQKIGPPNPAASRKAAELAQVAMWLTYKHYKKSHKMLSW